VVLGGTQQENNFNTGINPIDTEFILNGCQTRIPALKVKKHSNTNAGKVMKEYTEYQRSSA
jgi:hypothetical protein